MIVLDASVTVAWLLNEPGAPALELNAALAIHQAIVPAHWPTEVGNALLTAFRHKRIDMAGIARLSNDIQDLDIRIDPPRQAHHLTELIAFAEAYGLTTYDAAYVTLALETGAALASLDKAMRRVAIRLDIDILPA
ncbi:PIN domain-containing protein [Tardiphaga alba]|uniref:Ribonuclease VapC n=1 Tax=Tardiphaga alba TaxID=340268 RepID=A0ABX8A6C2_9BRAD|nr:type II toxin-antitoxin system VapC family toxin [Tardiphaga alba]QUS39239.1 PIN domain-containing protein [Tardiphaga alba]